MTDRLQSYTWTNAKNGSLASRFWQEQGRFWILLLRLSAFADSTKSPARLRKRYAVIGTLWAPIFTRPWKKWGMARRRNQPAVAAPMPRAPSATPTNNLAPQMQAMAIQQYSGPIPPPEMLARYDPEVRGIILRMAEDEQSQRNSRLNKALEADIEDRQRVRSLEGRGQWFGFGIGVAGIIAATIMAIYGEPVAASIIGALDLVALVSVFVTGRVISKKESS